MRGLDSWSWSWRLLGLRVGMGKVGEIDDATRDRMRAVENDVLGCLIRAIVWLADSLRVMEKRQ